jgi:hypothetical protein
MYQRYCQFKNLVSFVVLRALCVPIFFVTRRTQSLAQRTQRDALIAIQDSQYQLLSSLLR